MPRMLLFLGLMLAGLPAFALKPSPTYWARPDTLGLRYQDLTLTTPDHVRLAAWLIAPAAGAPDQHTTIVVAGGDAGNMASSIFPAGALAAQGYQVLLFDYRGFGHSEAFAIDQNMLYYPEFTTDLRTALIEARRLAPRQQRGGILGFSMGTIVGSEVAATAPCDFLVTVAYVASPTAIAAYYRRVRPERPVLLPADAAEYSQVAPRVKCPWLLIAGQQDPVTTLADSVATAQAARHRQRRAMLAVAGDHVGSMMAFSEIANNAAVQAISRFLAGGKA